MSTGTERQLATIAKLVEQLANDVNEMKHTLVGLAQSIGIADTAAAIATQSKAAEKEAARKAAFEEQRAQYVLNSLLSYEGPDGQPMRDYLERELAGTEYAPVRDEDLAVERPERDDADDFVPAVYSGYDEDWY